MKRVFVVVAALSIVAANAFGWSLATPAAGKVSSIQVLANGDINFWLVNNPFLCANAPNKSVGRIRVGFQSVTAEGLKSLHSSLMAAMKTVNVYANDNGPSVAKSARSTS